MNGLNRVIIYGTLGSEPRYLTSKDGRHYASLNLATNRSWKNKEGQYERRTDWHRVMVWGRKAQMCYEMLHKGSPVCVEGYLSSYEIPDENGGKRWMTSVTADEVNFLMPKKDNSEVAASEEQKAVN